MHMANSKLARAIEDIRRAMFHQAASCLSDGQLLDRFTQDRDEAAFAELVRRHGALVWGVCRRVLRRPHDAEEAFQVTFLALAQKAGGLTRPDRLANWLYGAAHRAALKVRAAAARRAAVEKQAAHPAPDPVAPDDPGGPWDD